MCRAGKDNTFRICPGQTNPDKVKDKNINRKASYMKEKVAKRLAAHLEKVALLDKEGAIPLKGKAREELLEKMIKEEVFLPSSDLTYRNHTKYAHDAVDQMKKCGFETDKFYNDNKDSGDNEHDSPVVTDGPIKDLAHSFTEVTHAGRTSKGDIVWNEERQLLHEEIMTEQLEKWKNLPRERKAIFSGGLGGAGKGTCLKSSLLNINQENYATLNPDDIKEVLAEKNAIPSIEGLTPMEASPLVHEEASHITKMLTALVVKRGINIIYDTTMGSISSTRAKIQNMKNAGYDVEAVFVDISMKTSDIRADIRHRSGHNRYLLGKGNGGRLLPRDVTADQSPANPEYRSKNAENFLTLNEEGLFMKVQAFDNDGAAPVPLTLDELKRPVVPAPAEKVSKRKKAA